MALMVVLSISVTQAIFVDIGGWFNKLVPQSWHESALAKKLPAVINAGDGWVDQYLAGYVWNQPIVKFSKLLGLKDTSLAGAFLGDFLVGVMLPAAVLLLVVYFFWVRNNYRKKLTKERGDHLTFKDELAGYWGMIMSSKRTAIAGLFLGIACGPPDVRHRGPAHQVRGQERRRAPVEDGARLRPVRIGHGL